ncbi:AIR carboxylase family protein [Candidatus Pacearchaeota archaeon]|nr:AIR carboxylase family protein [Candidatus Pacearchaeota archaeon]
MITEKFKAKIESGLGGVVIFAGSGSDKPHIDILAENLKLYEIPFEVRVVSAHKQSKKLTDLIREYDALRGDIVYIAVAGGTDALSGVLSYHSLRLTISCPPDHPNLSCINNPKGSSNVYIGRPENAARAVAQIFSEKNLQLTSHLEGEMKAKRNALEYADSELLREYSEGQK